METLLPSRKGVAVEEVVVVILVVGVGIGIGVEVVIVVGLDVVLVVGVEVVAVEVAVVVGVVSAVVVNDVVVTKEDVEIFVGLVVMERMQLEPKVSTEKMAVFESNTGNAYS